MSGGHLQHSDLERIFLRLDVNGDGRLSIDELVWLLDKVGGHIVPGDLEEIVGEKSLDLEEFILFCKSISDPVEEADEDLMQAFKVFDLNNDGFISCEELQSVLVRLGLWSENDGGCEQIVCRFDTNSDGQLDFEEFKQMMLLSIT
ncbi:PREDICTED: probable calcium-binding protein CML44 [Nelumbo nucifera]|uniref:EF-hand domain-containing protein n=2 Tax=Nelumbo nucifera TaxID=4432 RepID=A0A822XSY7_NELNU|nr:PREDICTED: probable calcium-binding protein CML44 [Nelumbo nucifera]DAD24724.1 TPA_asm: hypothetical protein HUJ06_026188 [Nelumbo nucifera]